MDAQDNKQIGLQKAISAHEQAQAALNDLTSDLAGDRYKAMLSRIEQNIADLHAESERSAAGDQT